MNPYSRRARRAAARTKARLKRVVLAATSIVATAGLIITGAVIATSTATAAAAGPTAGLDFGGYSGPRIVQVAGGSDQNMLALDADGGVWGWGLNANRQVTGTSTALQAAPVELTAVTGLLDAGEKITQLTAASSTSFALTSKGRVISWGANTNTALGRTTPVTAPGFVQRNASTQLTGITKIDGGQSHVLALDNTGHVWAWGVNSYAQLGINNLVNQQYAVQIPDAALNNVTDISAGWYHSLAVSNGKVKAWGYGGYGGVYYLGVAGTEWKVMTPTAVVTTSGMSADITTVEAGISYYDASYAIDVNGQLWSWGANTNGALGHDNAANVPNRVLDASNTPLTGVTQVTSGYYSGYAVAGDSVYAWGWNNYGQLGIGSTTNAARATKMKNFDLGGELGDVESIAGGWYNLAVVVSVGDDEGVLSITGHGSGTGLTTAAGANDTRHSVVPMLVWRFDQPYRAFPGELVPRSGAVTQTAGAPGFPTDAQQRLPEGDGAFDYGVTPFAFSDTTDGPAGGNFPVDYELSGACSLDAGTNLANVNSGNATCTVTRSFAGSALVAPLVTETFTVVPGRRFQDIAAFSTDAGGLFHGLTEESSRVALPVGTDAPAHQGSMWYKVDPDHKNNCMIAYADGTSADGVVTNAPRYLVVLGQGDCEVTVYQFGNSSRYEPMTKTVTATITEGRAAQSLGLTGLDGIRFADPNPVFTLPSKTAEGQDVTYQRVSGECAVSGTSLTATGAGDCVLNARADGTEDSYLPFEENRVIAIGKGIQSLASLDSALSELIVANSYSGALPWASEQGIDLEWSAETAEGSADFDPACQLIDVEGDEWRIQAGTETKDDESVPPAYAQCTITAWNDGNADWEAFVFVVTTEISERGLQSLDLSAINGKKYGDVLSEPLPSTTTPGDRPVVYTVGAGSSCALTGANIVEFTGGGSCVITATADGTTSNDGPAPWYRPFSTTVTAPVAQIGQYLVGMPGLKGKQVGSQSDALPAATFQGHEVEWSVSPAGVCVLNDDGDRVVLLSNGDCTLTGTADGDVNHTEFGYGVTFMVQINYSALDDVIAAAGQLIDDANDDLRYTTGSWNAFQAAFTAAEAARADGTTQAEIDEAEANLLAAKVGLVSTGALGLALAQLLTAEGTYTPETWEKYEEAIGNARAVLDDADATQEEIEQAFVELIAAEQALVHRADFSELQSVVDLAGAVIAGGHDHAAWPALQQARLDLIAELGEARAVDADKNSTQGEVDTARDELREKLYLFESLLAMADALDALDELGLDESQYTPESWEALLAAIDDAKEALSTVPAPTKAEIDALLTGVADAQSALVYRGQTVPGLEEALIGLTVGDDPVALPATTDRGGPVTYTIDTASADVCAIVDGMLVINGVGECIVNWTAPAVGPFPAGSGSERFSAGAGLQLVFDGIQLEQGTTLSVGDTLTARGEGLEPGSLLRIELHSTPVKLGQAVVAPDGTASVTFTIPADTKVGTHTLYAFGVSGVDGSQLVRSVQVRVALLPFTGVEPLLPLAGGLVMLLVGAGIMIVSRKRREAPITE